MSALRWLIDTPADGATNMARDEALLRRVGQKQSPPTLRFYRWALPTISLGYFQKYADFTSLTPPAGQLAAVRRQTGGGAIIHDQELTYSLILPLNHPLLSDGGCSTLYEHVHRTFADLLAGEGFSITRGPTNGGNRSHNGPFFCFERHCRFDLLIGGKKLMGSAQRRTKHALLQHGSLILDCRFDQQVCATVAEYCRFDTDAHLTQLAEKIADEPIDAPGRWEPAEHRLAEELGMKYADPAWTMRR